MTVYQRDESVNSIGQTGAFQIFTTPKITAAGGVDLNPVASLDPANLPLEQITPSAGAIKNIQQTGTTSGQVGEAETTITTFSADIQPENTDRTLPVFLEVSTPVRASTEDSVLTVGGYPEESADTASTQQATLRKHTELQT